MSGRARTRLAALVAVAALAAGCTVPTSDVNVINSRENPALVRPLAAQGWEPFQQTASVTNTIDVAIFTVPPDKRLTIEFVSGFCNASQNVPVHTVRLSGSVDHFLAPHVFATGAGTSFAVITERTQIYANPTAVVKLAVFPTSTSSTTTCSISLSGYLAAP